MISTGGSALNVGVVESPCPPFIWAKDVCDEGIRTKARTAAAPERTNDFMAFAFDLKGLAGLEAIVQKVTPYARAVKPTVERPRGQAVLLRALWVAQWTAWKKHSLQRNQTIFWRRSQAAPVRHLNRVLRRFLHHEPCCAVELDDGANAKTMPSRRWNAGRISEDAIRGWYWRG